MSPVTNVGSRWSGGDLIFYEHKVSEATIADILKIGDDAVTVGSATNDIDFKVFLGATQYVAFDWADHTVTFSTVDVAISGDLTVTVEDISVAVGRKIFLDGQDGDEFIYSPSAGVLTMQSSGTLSLDATTVVQISGASITLTGATTITGAVSVVGNLTMNTNKYLYFRDTGLSIYSPSDGVLSIGSDTTLALEGVTSLNLDGAAIHLTGVVTVTGATTITGAIGLVGNTTVDTNKYLYFRDTGLSIYSPSDGVLSIGSDTTLALEGITALNLDSTTIRLTGVVNVTGATNITGAVGIDGNITMDTTHLLYFRDTGLNIYSPADGILSLVSDTTLALEGVTTLSLDGATIRLTGTTNMIGAVTMSSTLGITGAITQTKTLTGGTVSNFGLYMPITETATQASGNWRAIYLNWNSSGTKTGGSLRGFAADYTLAGDLSNCTIYPVWINMTFTSNPTLTGGVICAVGCNIGDQGSTPTNSIYCFDAGRTVTNLGVSRDAFMRIRNYGAVAATSVFFLEGYPNVATDLFTFANAVPPWEGTTLTGGIVARLRVTTQSGAGIPLNTYYIPLYSS